ncbi:MAG: hypothetical protein ACLPX7_25610 [Xanthobacteraceae bacterium]
MRFAIVVVLGCLCAVPVHAQEPVGCDKFKWPLDQERGLLTSGKAIAIASGSSLKASLPVAVTVSLVPFADAKLPTAPGRAPRLPTSFAGFLQVAAPPHDGAYKISLSSEAWIDVVQAGHSLKSVAFSGATGCEGIRKSVKFELKAEPFAIQLSNVATNSIGVAISGD